MSGKTMKVKQVRSAIKRPQRQKDILVTLGLTRMNRVVEIKDNETTRGMIRRVEHLIEVID